MSDSELEKADQKVNFFINVNNSQMKKNFHHIIISILYIRYLRYMYVKKTSSCWLAKLI